MNSRLDDVLDWMRKNYRYLVIGVLFIVLVVVLLVVTLGKDKKEDDKKPETEQVEAADTQSVVPDVKFEEDKYPQVNELVMAYFTAMGEGNIETLRQLSQGTSEREEVRIQEKANFIESYNNFKCYTKPGPEENSYIVFAYYDLKFLNIATMAPSLTSLYVCTNSDGSLYVNNNDMSEETEQYIQAISEQEDVMELLTRVDTTYKESVDLDPDLGSFMTALPATLDDAVKKVMDARQAEVDAAAAAAAAAGAEQAAAGGVETVRVVEKVNVRKSASETADKLGQAEANATFTRLETLANGWSKIEYEGGEAYIKTDYLEVVSADAAQAPAETGEGDSGEASAPAESAGASTSSMTAKSNVNVRASANETAEKIGVIAGGDTVNVIENRNDGWTQVNFGGKTGYVKTEFLE